MADSLTRALIAIHEAGHAVAALQLGLDLRRIAIDSNVEGTAAYSQPSDRLWKQELVMTLTGDAAARLAGSTERSATDERDARRLAERHVWTDRDVAAVLADAERQADQLVAEHWAAIERVGAALMVKRKLYASDVRRLSEPGAAGDAETMFLMRLAIPVARR